MNTRFVLSASALAITSSAFATVSPTMVADTYTIADGGRTYSVLDIYLKSSNSNVSDVGNPLTGLSSFEFILATSKAVRTGAAVTSDIFVQTDNSSWAPTNTSGKAWDSFVTAGARQQGATVTNLAGSVKDIAGAGAITGATDFAQYTVANSNYINNGFNGGWLPTGVGSGAYSTSAAAQNPFARLSVYNAIWAPGGTKAGLAYLGSTLNRNDLNSKGEILQGRAAAVGTGVSNGMAGSTLDFHFMIGRFAIDVTGSTEAITMQFQGNMTGRHGSITSDNIGTIFTGATTASYKASQFFTFAAVPAPGAFALLGLAGLLSRHRRT